MFGYGIFPRNDIYSLDNTPFLFLFILWNFMPFFGIFIFLESFFIRSLVRRSVEKLGYTFLFLLYSRFKKGERYIRKLEERMVK